MSVRIGSLFSGAGGLDLAVERAFGGSVVWQSEVDEAACTVLRHRFPGVPNLGDITTVDWTSAETVDVLCGGYPCQPFSAAGKRRGTDDERHLWPDFAEAIRRLRPRCVVLENVAGHRSMGFDCVLGDLAEMRFDAQWCSIRASDVGAPHRRERVFILATDTTQRSAADIPVIGDSTGQHVGSVAGAGGGDRERATAAGIPVVGGTAAVLATAADTAGDGRDEGWPESAGFVGGSDISGDGPVDLLPTPRRSDGDGGKNPLSRAERMDDVETRVIRIAGQWGKYAPAINRWEAITRPAPSPTEPNTKGDTRLAPRFPEWMGYESGWVKDRPSRAIANDETTYVRDAALAAWGNRPAVVFGTWRRARPDGTRQVLVWDKTDGVGPGMGDLNAAFGTSHEEAYLLGEWRKRAARRGSVIRTSCAMGNPNGLVARTGHPTPKPVALMETLIECAPPGVIADPFAGSGSTLIAAVNQGREAIGVESDERYCELTAKRLSGQTMTFDFGAGAS